MWLDLSFHPTNCYIRLDREESALENVHLSSVCGRSSKTLPADKLVHTHPKVANLQVAMIRVHSSRYNHVSFPGCPERTSKDLLRCLENIPNFNNQSEVEKMLGSPDTEAGELLSWMFKNCGNDVIVASDHFEIRGMSKPVDQFLLIKPDKKRHQTFLNGMKKALSKSILLFHGTPLSNLYPILRDGFTPSYDERFGLGNFMAEEPKLSYDFAFKEAASYRRYKASEKLESYSGWGVLLGCEVPGNGRPVEDYTNSIPSGVHVIEDLASIAIRYIFLLPPPYAPQKMPARAVIRAQMMEAFQRFPADLP